MSPHGFCLVVLVDNSVQFPAIYLKPFTQISDDAAFEFLSIHPGWLWNSMFYIRHEEKIVYLHGSISYIIKLFQLNLIHLNRKLRESVLTMDTLRILSSFVLYILFLFFSFLFPMPKIWWDMGSIHSCIFNTICSPCQCHKRTNTHINRIQGIEKIIT